MSTTSIAVANHLITKAMTAGSSLTQMKLQKLLYFAQGWNLAVTDLPLFNEQIEAWKWGPVVRTVYSRCKHYGSNPIHHLVPEYELVDRRIVSTYPELPADGLSRPVVDLVWESYGNHSAVQLVALTHREGTPWHDVWKKYNCGDIPRGTDIPQDAIKTYFKRMLEDARASTTTPA